MPKRKKNMIESDAESQPDVSDDDFVVRHGQTIRQKAKFNKSRSKLINERSGRTPLHKPEASSDDTERHGSKKKLAVNISPGKHLAPKSPRRDGGSKEKQCPVKGCDSLGHIAGTHDRHNTITTCPLYHNMSVEACKKSHDDRVKHNIVRRRQIEAALSRPSNTLYPTREQQDRHHKIEKARNSRPDDLDEYREDCKEHESQHRHNREPLIQGITSAYDLKLFREAQARASENKEYELAHHYQLLDVHEYRIKKIVIGRFEMEPWYSSPYPEEYARLNKLYLCEFCLKYMKTPTIARRHATKCVWRYPPGNEIYRKGALSVFEVDGKKNKVFCQNLCLLAKLFLDHKTLYYDVEPFLFYVMTEADNKGCHIVGYFSKEKNSILNYNVSCILTMPQFMRKGYGKMLIDFSYLLSRSEGKIGSPERPLSDLGLISYRSYWKDVLMEYLHSYSATDICMKDLSHETAIHANDVVSTFQSLGMLKYWKGKHVILRNDDMVEDYIAKKKKRAQEFKPKVIDANCLVWSPPRFQENIS